MIYRITQLSGAVRVAIVDCYHLGEVWWFALLDEKGRRAHVCIDRRNSSPTYNRLFEGARHPERPKANLLDLGSVEEGIVVPLISRWLDSGGPEKQRMPEVGEKSLRDAPLRIGEPT